MRSVDHTKNIIEVKDISFSYGGELILDRVNLAVHPGDYLGLVGPNGAGKTTLLKIMLGLLTPDSGTVKLFGANLSDFSDHSKIAYVPQQATNFDVNFPLTVREVVAMGRYARRGLFRPRQSADQEIITGALKQVGLLDYQGTLIGKLSGGQAQRAFIARALAVQPEVIFLDEPTTGIDQKSQDDFYALLKKLNQEQGLTLVLVSHDLERVAGEVMHIACLDHNLVCHDSPADFLRDSDYLNLNGQQVKIMAHHHYHQ
jgi:zinc transport system ATP-binding protein